MDVVLKAKARRLRLKRTRALSKACECAFDLAPRIKEIIPELERFIGCFEDLKRVDAEATRFLMEHEMRQQ